MEENITKFEDKLKELIALAKKKKNVLEIQEINDAFSEIELDPDQMEKVFDFLESQNIDVLRISDDPDDVDDDLEIVITDEDEIDGYDTEDDKNSLHQAFSQTRKAQIAYPLPFYIQSRGARLRRPCSRPLLSRSDADYTRSRS